MHCNRGVLPGLAGALDAQRQLRMLMNSMWLHQVCEPYKHTRSALSKPGLQSSWALHHVAKMLGTRSADAIHHAGQCMC